MDPLGLLLVDNHSSSVFMGVVSSPENNPPFIPPLTLPLTPPSHPPALTFLYILSYSILFYFETGYHCVACLVKNLLHRKDWPETDLPLPPRAGLETVH